MTVTREQVGKALWRLVSDYPSITDAKSYIHASLDALFALPVAPPKDETSCDHCFGREGFHHYGCGNPDRVKSSPPVAPAAAAETYREGEMTRLTEENVRLRVQIGKMTETEIELRAALSVSAAPAIAERMAAEVQEIIDAQSKANGRTDDFAPITVSRGTMAKIRAALLLGAPPAQTEDK